MLKKYVLFLLIGLLLVSSCTFAKNREEKEVERLKKLFNIDDTFEHFDIDKQKTKDGERIGYHWEKKGTTIHIVTDNNGQIYDFSRNEEQRKQKLYHPEGYEKIADDVLKKIYPQGAKEYERLDEKTYYDKEGWVVFLYQRKINGFYVLGDTIRITLDLEKKDIRGYERTMDIPYVAEKDFPKAEKGMEEKGKKLFREKLGIVKGFDVREEGRNTFRAIPYYGMLYPNYVIELQTGNILDRDLFDPVKAEDGVDKALSPVEQKEVEKIKGVISKEQAQSRAREFYDLKHFSLDGYSLQKEGEDHIWMLNYISKSGNENWASFSIHGKNKSLLYMNLPNGENLPFDSSKASKLDLTQESLDFIEKAEKGLTKHIDNKKKIVVGSPIQNVNIPRKEEGFYYFDQGVSLLLNEKSKEVVQYEKRFLPYTPTSPKKDIGLSKAEEIIFDKGKGMLMYKYTNGKPIFIYGLKDPIKVKVETGEIKDFNQKQKTFMYEDIKKSKYPDQIKILGLYGIGMEENTWKPDQGITQREFLTMINQSLFYNNRDFIELTKQWETITNEKYNPKKEVRTIDGIKTTFSLFGFQNLKGIKDIFDKTLFKDGASYNEEERGYLYMAYGLGFLDRKDELEGKKSMTRDDAGHMLFELLNRNIEK